MNALFPDRDPTPQSGMTSISAGIVRGCPVADGSLFGDLRRPVVVDLFCGAGGTSLGVEMAGLEVQAAVDHWPYAIAMHAKNHPATFHFMEDVFDVEPWTAARGRLIDLLVGSPDCTDHSNAKGAAPRSTGRRALANVFLKWAEQVRPKRIILENVREFEGWGPLYPEDHPDPKLRGQRIPERKGEYFRAWVQALEALGYRVEWRLLRACDFGAPTSRLRLFVVARLDGQPQWPAPSHGPGLEPYRVAAECIDWSVPMRSIFGRERPLAEKTMARIAQGVRKFVLQSASPFLLCLSHGGRLEPITEPLRTVTAGPSGGDRALVAPHFTKFYGTGIGSSASAPMPTITAGAGRGGQHIGLVSAFLAKHYTGAVGSDLRSPVGTVTTQDHHSLVAAFLQKYHGASGQNQDIGAPLHTIDCKARYGLVMVDFQGEPWALTDIRMRMLEPRELARAQGFPDSYHLEGSKADQIAGIGNSVVPQVMAALVRANFGPAPIL